MLISLKFFSLPDSSPPVSVRAQEEFFHPANSNYRLQVAQMQWNWQALYSDHTVKRWHYLAIAAAGLALFGYIYFHPGGLDFGGITRLFGSKDASSSVLGGSGRPAHIIWQNVARPENGFKIDMPGDPKDLQVPAYNESGSSEPVKMLFSNPDGDTTFAISWEDNPPVARVNNRAPDGTLNMARDGMLARTQTTLVTESPVTSPGGYAARDVMARNSEGGILNARLIYAGNRLYILMALFPSSNARREQDVTRFFNSFVPSQAPVIPENMPTATPRGR